MLSSLKKSISVILLASLLVQLIPSPAYAFLDAVIEEAEHFGREFGEILGSALADFQELANSIPNRKLDLANAESYLCDLIKGKPWACFCKKTYKERMACLRDQKPCGERSDRSSCDTFAILLNTTIGVVPFTNRKPFPLDIEQDLAHLGVGEVQKPPTSIIPNFYEPCRAKISRSASPETLSPEAYAKKLQACAKLREIQKSAARIAFLSKQIKYETNPLNRALFINNCRSNCRLTLGKYDISVSLDDVATFFLGAAWVTWMNKIAKIAGLAEKIKKITDAWKLFKEIKKIWNLAKGIYNSVKGAKAAAVATWEGIKALSEITDQGGVKNALHQFTGNIIKLANRQEEVQSLVDEAKTTTTVAEEKVKDLVEFIFPKEKDKVGNYTIQRETTASSSYYAWNKMAEIMDGARSGEGDLESHTKLGGQDLTTLSLPGAVSPTATTGAIIARGILGGTSTIYKLTAKPWFNAVVQIANLASSTEKLKDEIYPIWKENFEDREDIVATSSLTDPEQQAISDILSKAQQASQNLAEIKRLKYKIKISETKSLVSEQCFPASSSPPAGWATTTGSKCVFPTEEGSKEGTLMHEPSCGISYFTDCFPAATTTPFCPTSTINIVATSTIEESATTSRCCRRTSESVPFEAGECKNGTSTQYQCCATTSFLTVSGLPFEMEATTAEPWISQAVDERTLPPLFNPGLGFNPLYGNIANFIQHQLAAVGRQAGFYGHNYVKMDPDESWEKYLIRRNKECASNHCRSTPPLDRSPGDYIGDLQENYLKDMFEDWIQVWRYHPIKKYEWLALLDEKFGEGNASCLWGSVFWSPKVEDEVCRPWSIEEWYEMLEEQKEGQTPWKSYIKSLKQTGLYSLNFWMENIQKNIEDQQTSGKYDFKILNIILGPDAPDAVDTMDNLRVEIEHPWTIEKEDCGGDTTAPCCDPAASGTDCYFADIIENPNLSSGIDKEERQRMKNDIKSLDILLNTVKIKFKELQYAFNKLPRRSFLGVAAFWEQVLAITLAYEEVLDAVNAAQVPVDDLVETLFPRHGEPLPPPEDIQVEYYPSDDWLCDDVTTTPDRYYYGISFRDLLHVHPDSTHKISASDGVGVSLPSEPVTCGTIPEGKCCVISWKLVPGAIKYMDYYSNQPDEPTSWYGREAIYTIAGRNPETKQPHTRLSINRRYYNLKQICEEGESVFKCAVEKGISLTASRPPYGDDYAVGALPTEPTAIMVPHFLHENDLVEPLISVQKNALPYEKYVLGTRDCSVLDRSTPLEGVEPITKLKFMKDEIWDAFQIPFLNNITCYEKAITPGDRGDPNYPWNIEMPARIFNTLAILGNVKSKLDAVKNKVAALVPSLDPDSWKAMNEAFAQIYELLFELRGAGGSDPIVKENFLHKLPQDTNSHGYEGTITASSTQLQDQYVQMVDTKVNGLRKRVKNCIDSEFAQTINGKVIEKIKGLNEQKKELKDDVEETIQRVVIEHGGMEGDHPCKGECKADYSKYRSEPDCANCLQTYDYYAYRTLEDLSHQIDILDSKEINIYEERRSCSDCCQLPNIHCLPTGAEEDIEVAGADYTICTKCLSMSPRDRHPGWEQFKEATQSPTECEDACEDPSQECQDCLKTYKNMQDCLSEQKCSTDCQTCLQSSSMEECRDQGTCSFGCENCLKTYTTEECRDQGKCEAPSADCQDCLNPDESGNTGNRFCIATSTEFSKPDIYRIHRQIMGLFGAIIGIWKSYELFKDLQQICRQTEQIQDESKKSPFIRAKFPEVLNATAFSAGLVVKACDAAQKAGSYVALPFILVKKGLVALVNKAWGAIEKALVAWLGIDEDHPEENTPDEQAEEIKKEISKEAEKQGTLGKIAGLIKCHSLPAVGVDGSIGDDGGKVCPKIEPLFNALNDEFSLIQQRVIDINLARRKAGNLEFNINCRPEPDSSECHFWEKWNDDRKACCIRIRTEIPLIPSSLTTGCRQADNKDDCHLWEDFNPAWDDDPPRSPGENECCTTPTSTKWLSVQYETLNPIYDEAKDIREQARHAWGWAVATNYAAQKCTCGRSICKMPLCISGLPMVVDPLTNVYCWITFALRNRLGVSANNLEEYLKRPKRKKRPSRTPEDILSSW